MRRPPSITTPSRCPVCSPNRTSGRCGGCGNPGSTTSASSRSNGSTGTSCCPAGPCPGSAPGCSWPARNWTRSQRGEDRGGRAPPRLPGARARQPSTRVILWESAGAVYDVAHPLLESARLNRDPPSIVALAQEAVHCVSHAIADLDRDAPDATAAIVDGLGPSSASIRYQSDRLTRRRAGPQTELPRSPQGIRG